MHITRKSHAHRAAPFVALAALGLAAALPQAARAQQTLYVSTFLNTVDKINSAGVVSTFYSGSGLNSPYGLAFDAAGNLYAANYGNSTIEKFTPGGAASVFATDTNGANFLAFRPNSVAAAPEPSEWATLGFTGLSIGGLLLRARKRVQTNDGA